MRDLRHRDAAIWPDVSDWLDALEFEGKRPRTLYAYERGIAPLLRTHLSTPLNGFTAADLTGELVKVPQRSRYISRSIYNTFFEWCEFDERLDRNPMRKVRKLKAGPKRPSDRFELAEVALLEALEPPHGLLFQLMFGTGLRRSECINLRRSHIDLSRMRLTVVDGKGGKDRVVPLTVALVAAVADLDLLERLEPTDYVWGRTRFEGPQLHRRKDPLGRSSFGRWYRECVEAAGVRYLSPHKTRHTFHWLLRQDGYDLEERQLLLGHESPETTVRQYPAVDIDDVARKRSGVA